MKQNHRKTAEGILFTDQYQLTMAQLYFRMGMHEQTVQFDYFFRQYPDYGEHKAGFCINAGLEWLLDWMAESSFRDEDIDFLRSQNGRMGKPVFQEDFLAWLRGNGNFAHISLKAIPEGRVIHPNEPITVVEGPLAIAQLLETPLLNHLNYPILVATRAARVCLSGKGQPLLEFGLRRGHGTGANAGARAALIGGADFTSNVGISHVLGFPPKGTHGHSMVQAFMAIGMGELEAFRAYADCYPDDCLLLVDTIDTINSGIPNAITVFEELRKKGSQPVGIRLDSGDLAALSVRATKMLNEAGFSDTIIVLSDNLDELKLIEILEKITELAPRSGLDADKIIKRLSYGVGTHLITSQGASALGGIYKLTAVKKKDQWLPSYKISESPQKIHNPGVKNVWRLYDQKNKAMADMLCLHEENPNEQQSIDLFEVEGAEKKSINQAELSRIEPLLVNIIRKGKLVYELPTIEEMREVRQMDLDRLETGMKNLIKPDHYPVLLSHKLYELRTNLIQSGRNNLTAD